MNEAKDTKDKILAEIRSLSAELESRKAMGCPLPDSVLRAYRIAIDRQYRLLDRLKACDPA